MKNAHIISKKDQIFMSNNHIYGSRRHLPSTAALAALEAVDRLGSASAAAEELSLTQGAISRALQSLEAQLQVSLVTRDKRRLKVTSAGAEFLQSVRPALQSISQAALKLRANAEGGTLTLSILPAFGVHWLGPRLARFSMQHPGITINLSTRLRPFDLAAMGFDAAVHFGKPDWPGADHLFLMNEEVLPVCAPSLLQSPVTDPVELLKLPLLQLEGRPGAWKRYLRSQGVEYLKTSGMVFDQFASMTQAALHGLGVALLPLFLIEEALEDERLVTAWPAIGRDLGDYYLVWSKAAPERAPLMTFRSWLAKDVQRG